MSTVHDKPVCLDCTEPIQRTEEIVFAAPFNDGDIRSASACFHGLCLMRWRERRDAFRDQMRVMEQAFERHVNRECSCYEDEDD